MKEWVISIKWHISHLTTWQWVIGGIAFLIIVLIIECRQFQRSKCARDHPGSHSPGNTIRSIWKTSSGDMQEHSRLCEVVV